VFENRVLRTMFGPNWDGVMGGWGKLYSEKLHDLYSSPSIIKLTKSRWVRWAEHVARMGRRRRTCIVIGRKARGKETTRKAKA
jgi:hypothetical protein